jgi:hypothetical protein
MMPVRARDALSKMTPVPRGVNINNPSTVSDYLAAQLHNPNDILSILLLLGPDVIQRAIAQLVGRKITPVAFSFGWVAYAVGALLSAVGGERDYPLIQEHS